MRVLVAFLLVLIPFLSEGQLVWNNPTIDFGTIREDDGIATRFFTFKNSGVKNVAIERIISSCGCTTVKNYNNVVKKGVSDSLTVAYNPVGRPGSFNKLVKVITADSVYQLRIIGNVIPSEMTVKKRFPVKKGSLALSNGIMTFDEVALGQRKSVRFFGCNLSEKTLPLALEGLPKGASYSFYPDTVAAGNVFSIAVTFMPDTADFGIHHYSPVIIAGEERLALDMSVTVVAPSAYEVSGLAECRLLNDRITFADYGGQEFAKAYLSVENVGKADLFVKGIVSDCETVSAVNAFPMTVKPGEKAMIEFALDVKKENKSILNNILVIYTNDPKAPNRRVRLVGSK